MSCQSRFAWQALTVTQVGCPRRDASLRFASSDGETTAMRHEPFADLSPTPVEHFKLAYFAAISHVLERVTSSFESREAALAQFPFLTGYRDELAARGVPDSCPLAWWGTALQAWEQAA